MTHEKAASALQAIAPGDRATWVRMGMALKSEFGDDAFDLWNAWSQSAASYCRKSALAVWRSIGTAGRIRIGTLYREAAANGWRYAQDQLAHSITHCAAERSEDDASEEARKGRAALAAAAEAQRTLAQCRPSTHPYLIGKGLPSAMALVRGPTLIVPMYDFLTSLNFA